MTALIRSTIGQRRLCFFEEELWWQRELFLVSARNKRGRALLFEGGWSGWKGQSSDFDTGNHFLSSSLVALKQDNELCPRISGLLVLKLLFLIPRASDINTLSELSVFYHIESPLEHLKHIDRATTNFIVNPRVHKWWMGYHNTAGFRQFFDLQKRNEAVCSLSG